MPNESVDFSKDKALKEYEDFLASVNGSGGTPVPSRFDNPIENSAEAPRSVPPTGRSVMSLSVPKVPATSGSNDGAISIRDLVSGNIASKADPLAGALDAKALADVQAQAKEGRNVADLGNAGAQLGYAIAGVKAPETTGFEQLRKGADQSVSDFVTQRKAAAEDVTRKRDVELSDPNSTKSIIARNLAKARIKESGGDPSVVEGLSAEDLHGFGEKSITGMESNATRREIAKGNADARRQALEFRDSQLQDRNDFTAHKNILQKVKSDKMLTEAATKAQNISNVLGNLDKTGVITPQDMADVQAIAVANMGVQGAGSAHERAERYAKTLGMKAADAEQFLTGKPVSIGKDNPMFQRYKDIMQLELGNFGDRADKRIKALTAGNKSIYARRPDLQSDLDDLRSQMLGQLPPMPAATSNESSSATPPGFSPEKMDRLQKLRAKRDAGTLGK